MFNCQSEFDGLSVDHGTEGLAVLDRFLALPMEEPLLAADLNREEIGLFEGLHELLLMLELLHVANLAIKGISNARCHCHSTSVFVKLDLAHGRSHNGHGAVNPVQGESRCNELAAESCAVHVLPAHGACDSHATLEAHLLNLEWHESALMALSRVKNGSLVTLESNWILHLVEELVVERVVLVIWRGCGVGCGGDAGEKTLVCRFLAQLVQRSGTDNHFSFCII